jgi:cytochrome b6-f complex iron-sulfur subunit
MNTDKKQIRIERRWFLKKLWIALGIIAGGEVIYLFYNFLRPNKHVIKPEKQEYFDAGMVSSFKKNTISSFRSRQFFLSRLENGEFIALSTRCTHLGCSLTCDEEKNLLICPCHSSVFDIEGKVLRAPATQDLDVHEVIIEQDRVKVNTGIKAKRIRK